jgi:hypothetical protein
MMEPRKTVELLIQRICKSSILESCAGCLYLDDALKGIPGKILDYGNYDRGH